MRAQEFGFDAETPEGEDNKGGIMLCRWYVIAAAIFDGRKLCICREKACWWINSLVEMIGLTNPPMFMTTYVQWPYVFLSLSSRTFFYFGVHFADELLKELQEDADEIFDDEGVEDSGDVEVNGVEPADKDVSVFQLRNNVGFFLQLRDFIMKITGCCLRG